MPSHTHQDQLQIFYDYLPSSLIPVYDANDPDKHQTHRDTTKIDFTKPLQISYIGPSITPLTGLNSGYRVYQVDSKTFSIMGAQTYFANMSNSLTWTKPVWEFEYDTREAYSVVPDSADPPMERDEDDITKHIGIPWPSTSPLNATFWHFMTEKMLHDSKSDSTTNSPLLELYERYEAKSSTHPDRRGSNPGAEQKVCFLRAGSGYLGRVCRERYGGGDARSLRERGFGVR